MQQLSRLDYNFMTILNSLDLGPPQVTMQTLVSTVNNSPSTVDDITHKTTRFMKILKVPTGDCWPSSTPALAVTIRSSKFAAHETGTRSYSGEDSDDFSDEGSFMETPNYEQELPDVSPSTTCSPTARRELDTPCYLLIIMVYIRLLRLYLIIPAHIHQYLKALFKSNDPHLHTVPR